MLKTAKIFEMLATSFLLANVLTVWISANTFNLSQICYVFDLVRTLSFVTSHNSVHEPYWIMTGYCQNQVNTIASQDGRSIFYLVW